VRHLPLSVLTILVTVHAVAETSTLVPLPGGGWRTDGLPYEVRVSAGGQVTALVVAGFDFIGSARGEPAGFHLADGTEALPFATVAATGNQLWLGNDRGALVIRFVEGGLEVTVDNRAIADSHCARLALTNAVSRIRSVDRGIEHGLPLKSAIRAPARLIAPNGASLSLGRSRSYHLGFHGYVLPAGPGLLVKFPAVKAGMADTFHVPISAHPRPEDSVRMTVEASAVDFTFWSDAPQHLTTRFSTAVPVASVEVDIVLQIRSYLTKEVVAESRQRLTLKGDGEQELTWPVASLDPMLYIAEFWVVKDGERGLCGAPRFVYDAARVLPPSVPADFDAFWERTLAEQAAVPLDLRIERVREQGAHTVHKFSFAGLLGYRCYGWLTIPKGATGKVPGVLVLPPAGMRSQPVPIFPDAVGMRININTVDVDLPPEGYEWRTWPAPYLVTGMLDRDHYSLRFGYAACVRAAEVLAARPEVDPARVRVTGSSQGGGLTLVAAGLYPGFESAEALKPGLCRLDWNLNYLQPPFFPIAVNESLQPQLAHTLRYFLPSHFARRITCPIAVSLGLHDDVTPAVGVFCAYNAIPGNTKKITVDARGGH